KPNEELPSISDEMQRQAEAEQKASRRSIPTCWLPTNSLASGSLRRSTEADPPLSLLKCRLLERALRPGQAVMLTQRLALIGRAEPPAPLQQRDHLRAEDVQHRRQQRRHDVEAVSRAIGEPLLDQVGDLLRRAGKGEMAASTGKTRQQLPQRWLLSSHQAQDHLGPAAR